MERVQKARTQLGLADSFTHDDLDAAYRRAAAAVLKVPPESRDELIRSLIEDRDLLAAQLGPRPGTGLARRSALPVDLRPALPADAAAHRRAASERAVQAVVMHHNGRLGRLRQTRFTVGLVMWGLAAAGVIARISVLDPKVGLGFLTLGAPFFALGGAIFGVMGWAVGGRERYLLMRVEGIADSLADRALLEDLLDEIAYSTEWTRREFRQAIDHWIAYLTDPPVLAMRDASPTVTASNRLVRVARELAARARNICTQSLSAIGILPPPEKDEAFWAMAVEIGPTDFADVLLAKAFEAGAIEEAVIVDLAGACRHGYRRTTVDTN
jgi:hypothetical protein